MSHTPSRPLPSRPRIARPARRPRTPDRAVVPQNPPENAPSLVPAFGELGLNGFAPYLLNRVSAQWNARLSDLLRHLGLTTTMFRALAVLTVSSGITVNEVAVFAVTEQSTMSRTLDALEDAGLIRRRAKADDMRVREVFITDAGLALFARVWPDIYRLHARVFAGVDEAEFHAFTATLHKIMRNTQGGAP